MRQKFILLSLVIFIPIIGVAVFYAVTSFDHAPTTPSSRVARQEDKPFFPGSQSTDGGQEAPSQSRTGDGTQPSIPTRSSEQGVTRDPERLITIDNKQYPLRQYRPMALPNDPQGNQWWINNTRLAEAWDVPRGSSSTLLAVIDTGFGLAHEELRDRWYSNPGETGSATSEAPSRRNCTARGLAKDSSCNLIDEDFNGVVDDEIGPVTYENPSRLNCTDQGKPLAKDCNLIDDDANNYIDDVRGWDFANNDNSPQAGELNPSGSGTTHGTLVAGVAAATGNNNVGIAGADWGTQILPIQALDDDSIGNTWSVGRGIYYAINRGADVISISLGSSLPDDYVLGAVQAALARGIVVVAAAGNDGCECMVYPARYAEVVGVGALNTSNLPASFSSWGTNLDVLAPGTDITSSTWTAANPTSAYTGGVAGTSFATPMVAGMMTRLLSLQPAATPQQLVAAFTESTNRAGLPANAAHSTTRGYGSADAYTATQRVISPSSPPMLYTFTPIQKGSYLQPSNPLEPNGPYPVYKCLNGSLGTTPIYQLTKPGSPSFFSISTVENTYAQASGYASTLFAYGCVGQPQDTPTGIRNIDVFREFFNGSDGKQ